MNIDVQNITGIDEYLAKAGKMLAKHVQDRFKPLQEIGTGHEELALALRKPFAAQSDAILATKKVLERSKAAILVGEMGTGKSLMGALAADAYAKAKGQANFRTIVMSPSHLTKKWPREILCTIKDSRVFVIRSFTNVEEMVLTKDGDTEVKNNYSLEHLKKCPPLGITYFCLSKEQAKLGYKWIPAVNPKVHLEWVETSEGKMAIKSLSYHCPQCGAMAKGKNDEPVDLGTLGKTKTKCQTCQSPLWTADGKSYRRIAVSDYISKKMRGFFDLLVADEVHELKGGDTAQGNSFGQMISACQKTICLTGTLLGGYADDIFYILFRLYASKLKADGMEYKDVTKWTARFGCLESITKEKSAEDNKNSKGSKKTTTLKRKPGISPLVFGKFLLEQCVFLELADIADQLPGYCEEVVSVKMDPEHMGCYKDTEKKLSDEVKRQLARGNKQMLSTLLHTLLSYADGVFEEVPVFNGNGEIFMTPPVLPASHETEKERALIEAIKSEVKEGRKCLVYITYTNHRTVKERLVKKLATAKIPAVFMPSSIKSEERETWINAKVEAGAKVVMCNPECVKTGLDLLAFPTIMFFQTGYNVYTLRQASRRSWRLGQKHDVKVMFFTYMGTIQETALQLIGKKLEASMALEGKFSEEGLMAMTSGDDMSTALAKALVHGLSDTEGVENIWKNINAKSKGSAVNIDGEIHDIDLLLSMGWPKENAERYLELFPDKEQRRKNLEMLLDAYRHRKTA